MHARGIFKESLAFYLIKLLYGVPYGATSFSAIKQDVLLRSLHNIVRINIIYEIHDSRA